MGGNQDQICTLPSRSRLWHRRVIKVVGISPLAPAAGFLTSGGIMISLQLISSRDAERGWALLCSGARLSQGKENGLIGKEKVGEVLMRR